MNNKPIADSKLITDEIYKKLKINNLADNDFESENLLDLIDELKSSFPELNYYYLYNITISDVFRIINENDQSIEFDLTVSEPCSIKLVLSNSDNDNAKAKKTEKSILLLLVLLFFLHQTHLVINIKFKNDKNKLLIPFQHYLSFLSRNSILITSNHNQKFSYVMPVESAIFNYCKGEKTFNDQIDCLLQKKINKSHLSPDSLLNYPVAADLQQYESQYKNCMKQSESLAEKLAMSTSNIFKTNNKLRLF
ncbi:hypothetical protein [Psychrosphaera aestuarii]|uniref:hypothetical protein n=1 Tax=Psychrosphaera aestuarii TaxID=1266052 RepID=UPI001B33141E|nr:hypothetical protein [Psychrosphaera aestuarii]